MLILSFDLTYNPLFFKHVLSTDAIQLGYTDDGHCKGQPHRNLPGPQRLQWNIPPEVHHVLRSQPRIAGLNSKYYNTTYLKQTVDSFS